ncbi:MAG: ABC-2 transporter permease [Oscillospiraceae bacterium]|nr:ABC-2 transporter permease [Oscillospiraceae bacterium]
MRGLLVKDFRLMKMQRRLFIIVIAIGLIMAISMNDSAFLLGYITVVIPFSAISTISYDELGNGNAFLFTLPISRKEYVYEKYGFSLLWGVLALAAAVVLAVVFDLLKGNPILETLTASPLIFGIVVAILAVMIPIQLKFGADKGRIALIAVLGAFVALGFSAIQIFGLFGVEAFAWLDRLLALNFGTLVAVTAIVVTALFLLSMRISVAMMNKKEF